MGNNNSVSKHNYVIPKDILLTIFKIAITNDKSLAVPISKTCKWAREDKFISSLVRKEMSAKFDVFFAKNRNYKILYKHPNMEEFRRGVNSGNSSCFIEKAFNKTYTYYFTQGYSSG